jgi:hypothetical protein
VLSVVAAGHPVLEYQWRFNGGDIPGATGDTLTINSTTSGNTGEYDVVVTNDYGTVTSNLAILVVHPCGP